MSERMSKEGGSGDDAEKTDEVTIEELLNERKISTRILKGIKDIRFTMGIDEGRFHFNFETSVIVLVLFVFSWLAYYGLMDGKSALSCIMHLLPR